MHNSFVYQFHLKHAVLNKDEPKRRCFPLPHATAAAGKADYFIATHVTDKGLSEISGKLQVSITGSQGTFGKPPFDRVETG